MAARVLLLATLLTYAGYAAIQTAIATDVWWALAAGRYIVEHGAVPRVDVFSHTYAGASWVNGEWLSQVLFYAIYHWGGATSLALFKIAMAAGFYLAAAWIGWRRSGSLVFAVVATATVIGCRTFFDIKSDLFLFAGTLGLLALLEEYRRGAPMALLLAVPFIFALWVNLHFSFVYGLGVLLLLGSAEVVKATLALPRALPMRRAQALVAVALVAFVACLLNPYGVRGLTYPFAILDRDNAWRRGITEWLPTVLFREAPQNAAFFGYYFTAQCLLAVGALIVAPRRFDLSNALHVAVAAAMALSARRFVGLFALVAAPFAATNLAILWEALAPRLPFRPFGVRARTAVLAVLCVGAVTPLVVRGVPYARRSYADGLFAGTVEERYFPIGAVEFLNRNPLPARLFHLYTWGGYIMFRTRRPVFVDGRGHLVYPDAFYGEDSVAEYGAPGWAEVLDRRQVSVIVWPSTLASQGSYRKVLDMLGGAPQWQRIYDDGQSAVFAHTVRGRPWVDAYQRFALDYPDNPKALVFLGEQYLAANRFEPARRLLADATRRIASGQPGASAALDRLADAARASQAPDLWFRVAFYRDVRDERATAAEAYAEALSRGLAEPYAAYAREALSRLRGD